MTPIPGPLAHDAVQYLYAAFKHAPGGSRLIVDLAPRVFGLKGRVSVRMQTHSHLHELSFDGVCVRFQGSAVAAIVPLMAAALERQGLPVPEELAALSVPMFAGGHVELLPGESQS